VDSRTEDDLVLCECEMVSRNVIDSIIDEAKAMRGRSMLKAIGMRSRVGKGPCQGGFCGPRITAHLYDRGMVEGMQGWLSSRPTPNAAGGVYLPSCGACR
jgi:glycerol-3-phosphate dehydrogenase